jgi:hypothetical protein
MPFLGKTSSLARVSDMVTTVGWTKVGWIDREATPDGGLFIEGRGFYHDANRVRHDPRQH